MVLYGLSVEKSGFFFCYINLFLVSLCRLNKDFTASYQMKVTEFVDVSLCWFSTHARSITRTNTNTHTHTEAFTKLLKAVNRRECLTDALTTFI